MIDRLIKWSLEHRVLVLAAALLLVGWGAVQAATTPIDVFPDLTAPTVTVLADAHGMAPSEVERQLTIPLENALGGAPGIRRIRSATAVGMAIVWIEFDWGTDIYRARQIVGERLAVARAALPGDVGRPVLAPITSIMGEVVFVALTSDEVSPIELRTLADWQIGRRLLAVPGVAKISVYGGEVKQYQVVARPERVEAYDLTISDLTEALGAAGENATAGLYVEGGEEYLIQGIGRLFGVEDIEGALVAYRDGEPVLVRDVAHVRVGPELKVGEGSYNGGPAVIVGVLKQPGVNTLELTGKLDLVLDDLTTSLPEGVEIHRDLFRQADFISVAVTNVAAALRDGAILVVLIIAIFLISGRSTAITVLAIPLSLLTSVVAMRAMGQTINTMTLGGMAIAVGALVDDAIIDVENVMRRLRENAALPPEQRRPAVAVVFDASREIRGSIVFATLIILLVFTPLFFLTGVEGRLLEPLGFAYAVSLAASLVVALTVTPVLCSLLLPRSGAVLRGREPVVARMLRRGYDAMLGRVVARWKPVTIAAALLLGLGVVALATSARAFLPGFNEGTLTISAVTVPGASLEQSDAIGRTVEQILLEIPEVVSTSRKTGRADLDEHAQGSNSAEIDVPLEMGERSRAEVVRDVRERLGAVPGTNVIIGQPISHRIDHMLSGSRAQIAIKIFGPDLGELRQVAGQVEAAISEVEGIVDLGVAQRADIPLVTVRFKREALARHGMRTVEATHALEAAFLGTPVAQVMEGEATFDVVLRYGDGDPESFEVLTQTPITTPSGARVPLHTLAEVRRDRGPNLIDRESGGRKMVVKCNAAGRPLMDVVDDIRERIAARVQLPQGYRYELGGQFEAASSASRALMMLGAIVVVGIFLLLQVALRSTRDALLVMLNLPLALIGGAVGVQLLDGELSVAALIGFITLFGIATRNGIMMITHIRHLVEVEGVTDRLEAITRGASERLAPIMMTALASGLGLLPLALALGEPGSEIQAPMAIVILCGLVTSTALNMFVVPALYLRFGALGAGQSLTERVAK